MTEISVKITNNKGQESVMFVSRPELNRLLANFLEGFKVEILSPEYHRTDKVWRGRKSPAWR